MRGPGLRIQRRVIEVTFTKDAALTALPLQMQEEMTERAVLIGGASVRRPGPRAGILQRRRRRLGRLPGQAPGLLLRRGGAAGQGSQAAAGADPAGPEREHQRRRASWGGERAVSVSLDSRPQRAGPASALTAARLCPARDRAGSSWAVRRSAVRRSTARRSWSRSRPGAARRSLDELRERPDSQRRPARRSGSATSRRWSEREGLAASARRPAIRSGP